MTLKTYIFVLLSALIINSFTPANAYAQQDIGDIIDEIFKSEQPNTPQRDTQRNWPLPDPSTQYPSGQEPSSATTIGLIDNIPVDIRFDTEGRDLPAEAMLVVSAYAPPPPNVRRAAPLMLGQTRLLMSGMGSPVQAIVAAPASITQDLEYARVEAKIIDINGATIFELPFPGKYQGYEALVLKLVPLSGVISKLPPKNSSVSNPRPHNSGSTNPSTLSSETVRGSVKLNGPAPKFSGSNLVVRLVEDGLAGGNSSIIAGETRQVLDGKRVPFTFEFERVIDNSRTSTPLALEVWIEDWAGRKTHVTPAPIPYNGPDTKYRIKLDAIGPQPYNPLPRVSVPRNPVPKPVATPKPAPIIKPRPIAKPTPGPIHPITSARQQINGQAQFNANKGLPKGSVLIAVLERTGNASRPNILASSRVTLDGLSGDVAFKLTANTIDLAPNLPIPMLRVRIESNDGTLFFSNPGGTRYSQGFNTVKLRTSPNY